MPRSRIALGWVRRVASIAAMSCCPTRRGLYLCVASLSGRAVWGCLQLGSALGCGRRPVCRSECFQRRLGNAAAECSTALHLVLILIGYEVGVGETANVTSIDEEHGLACTGTPRECDWDREADAHNNSIGARAGESAMGRFGTWRGCDDPNAVPEVGRSPSWHRGKLIGLAEALATPSESSGDLDTRGGCPSSYADEPQGC